MLYHLFMAQIKQDSWSNLFTSLNTAKDKRILAEAEHYVLSQNEGDLLHTDGASNPSAPVDDPLVRVAPGEHRVDDLRKRRVQVEPIPGLMG